jgi:hypothetical protein
MSSRFCDGRRAFTEQRFDAAEVSTSCPCSSTRKLGGMKRSSSRSYTESSCGLTPPAPAGARHERGALAAPRQRQLQIARQPDVARFR